MGRGGDAGVLQRPAGGADGQPGDLRAERHAARPGRGADAGDRRMNLRFPYQFDGRGRTADADEATWIRGLVEQVLFTSPGERVMRPDFGSGLMQLVFAPNSPELAATTQFLV